MKDEKTDIAKELSRICKEKGISRYSLSKRTGNSRQHAAEL